MQEIEFELGQWVTNEDGYGQIMYIRAYFVEDYENYRQGRKNGEFVHYVYICKILCGFDGKIRNSKRINIYTKVNPIDPEGLGFLEVIKLKQKDEYRKYILFDDKNSIHEQLFLHYKLDILDYNKELIKENIREMNHKLYPSFTFKEFSKLFKKYNSPFQLENLIKYGEGNKDSIMLRFDSHLYKTKDKEAIFDYIRIFF